MLNRAGVNVSCRTIVHAQVTGGVGLTYAPQHQVDHQDATNEWEAPAVPQVSVNHVVNGAHTCPSIRLPKPCTIREQTLSAEESKGKKRKDYAFRRQFNEKPSIIPGCPGSAEDNLQSEGTCNSRRFRVHALLQDVPKRLFPAQ